MYIIKSQTSWYIMFYHQITHKGSWILMLCKSLGTLRTFPLVSLCHRRFGERCFTIMIIIIISIFINRSSHDQALKLQHHASKTMQVAGGAGYSVARVTETRKRMEIRGLNWSPEEPINRPHEQLNSWTIEQLITWRTDQQTTWTTYQLIKCFSYKSDHLPF